MFRLLGLAFFLFGLVAILCAGICLLFIPDTLARFEIEPEDTYLLVLYAGIFISIAGLNIPTGVRFLRSKNVGILKLGGCLASFLLVGLLYVGFLHGAI